MKRKQKALADPGTPKALSYVGRWWVTFSLGIHPRWIKSLLISREAHSPIPKPSSFRLLGSPFTLSIHLPTFRSRLSPSIAACLCLSCLFFFFFEFPSMFSAPLEKLTPPAETNSTFLLIPLLRAA